MSNFLCRLRDSLNDGFLSRFCEYSLNCKKLSPSSDNTNEHHPEPIPNQEGYFSRLCQSFSDNRKAVIDNIKSTKDRLGARFVQSFNETFPDNTIFLTGIRGRLSKSMDDYYELTLASTMDIAERAEANYNRWLDEINEARSVGEISDEVVEAEQQIMEAKFIIEEQKQFYLATREVFNKQKEQGLSLQIDFSKVPPSLVHRVPPRLMHLVPKHVLEEHRQRPPRRRYFWLEE